MTTSILKSLFAGAIIGAVLFFMPGFICAIFFFMILMKMLFFAGMRRRFAYHHARPFSSYTDTIRNFSDEEYELFKNQMPGMPYLPKSNKK